MALRSVLVPALDLWESLNLEVKAVFHEDNEAMIQVCRTGKNPTMRHISRTHGVNVQWLHDAYTRLLFKMNIAKTDEQVADIFTKHFPEKGSWKKAVREINTGPIGDPVNRPPVHDPEAQAAKNKQKQVQYGTGTSKKANNKNIKPKGAK